MVEGNERYTEEQIIEAAGVQKEQNLVLLNKYKVKQSIFDTLPYVETVVSQPQILPTRAHSDRDGVLGPAALTGEKAHGSCATAGKVPERASHDPDPAARA
ncbi:MAG: FtsQ-type POTRA domain-containing protein [Oscillibacter sp.]